jgi:hypothetical protein
MISIPHNQRRWLCLFWLSIAILVGTAAWSNSRLESFRDPAINFYNMKPGELFVVDRMTRRQEGSVKLGFAEKYDPPQVGLYGNHIFRYFDGSAFGHPDARDYFFNYWYANLALPEIYRYLRHLEELGHLPKKLILVQITSPNIDNGLFIINFGYELPPDLLLIGAEAESFPGKLLRVGSVIWQVLENWLHELFNYSTFISGLRQEGDLDRVVDPANCQGEQVSGSVPELLRRMPLTIQDIFGSAAGNYYCQPRRWPGAFRRDGSIGVEPSSERLVKNEEELNDSQRGLKAGDERIIARQLLAIDALGRRHGTKVVFVVPPAYETNREGSIVNQIFNRGLALAPNLSVIDDREMHGNSSLFVDYEHPSSEYFRLLVEQLRRRRFVD